jgi:hypothetical protein
VKKQIGDISVPLRLAHDRESRTFELQATVVIDADDLDSDELRQFLAQSADADGSYKTFVDGPYRAEDGREIRVACTRHSMNPEVTYCGRVPWTDEYVFANEDASYRNSPALFCPACMTIATLIDGPDQQRDLHMKEVREGHPTAREPGGQAWRELVRRAPRLRLSDVRPAGYATLTPEEQRMIDVDLGIVADDDGRDGN